MKYWLIFLIIVSGLYIQALISHPIYVWKNPNWTVKTIKITDKIYLIYYKKCEGDIGSLALSYRIEF